MVHIQLAKVDWLEVAVLTVALLMDCVWVDKFIVGFDIDRLALVSCA